MNRVNLLLVLGICLLLDGCRSRPDPYQRRVRLTMLDYARPQKDPDTITVYEYKNAVTEEYDVIGLMQGEGVPEEAKRFKAAFRLRAAAIGADGLIFKPINLDDGSGVRLSSVAAFRGEAIVFR